MKRNWSWRKINRKLSMGGKEIIRRQQNKRLKKRRRKRRIRQYEAGDGREAQG